MFAYIIIKFIQKILYFFPQKFILNLGNFLGILGYYIVKSKRLVVLDNLKKTSMPQEFAKDIFKNFGITVFEILLLDKYKKEWRYLLDLSDDVKQKYLNATKNGAILLASHFNNWEILALFSNQFGDKVLTVGQEVKNQYLNKLIKDMRLKNLYLASLAASSTEIFLVLSFFTSTFL